MRRAVIVALALSLVAACTGEDTASTTDPPGSTVPATASAVDADTTTTTATDGSARSRNVQPFATFQPIPLLVEGNPYPGPEWPQSLDGVIRQPWTIPTEQAAAGLLANGFVVVPSRGELFHPLYKSYEAEQVWFVTTDVGYHHWHLAFDKVLREVETRYLLPALEQLVDGLLEGARAQYQELAGTELEEPADRVVQLVEAAITLLEREAGSIGPLASREVELALAAVEKTESPTTSFAPCRPDLSPASCIDYSLFRPRGHYTRSPELERYFRAMSLLGQASFFVGDPSDPDWDHRSFQLGLLTARLLAADSALSDLWATIYEPTAFMVGLADDFTPFELIAVANEVAPGVVADPQGADASILTDVATALIETREVAIDPEATAVRMMGARFVIDAYVLDQMVRPHVGTLENPRRLGSALDLAAAFGSVLAYDILDRRSDTSYENFDAQLDLVSAELDARTDDDWARTVYDGWLYALRPKLVERGTTYPAFMQTPAWAAKDLQTALGSYAELKHDTILYAKQSSAAEGDFTPLPEPARHWVEPDPVAFGRLAEVARMLSDGLSERNLIAEEQERLLDGLQQMLSRLARIAADELGARHISEEDNQWLDGIGSLLESLWYLSADIEEGLGGMPDPADMDAAIIADIQSNEAVYLEIGTGWVDRILVLVPNDSGRFQVASGAVYSFYEFARPRNEQRLTDDEWRDLLRNGRQPPRPEWQQVFLAPEQGGSGLLDLRSGLLCRDVAASGYQRYEEVVAYWVREGQPDRMDADRNGIPCETVYEPYDVDGFFDQVSSLQSGLRCADLSSQAFVYAEAVAYWLLEGAPERMDADRNGIPCDTVYDLDEIERYIWFERG